MVYTMPPINTNGNTGEPPNSANVRTWQEPSSTAEAQQSVADRFRGGKMVEVFWSSNGMPYKAYVKDAHGKMNTVSFDGSQNIAGSMSGCH